MLKLIKSLNNAMCRLMEFLLVLLMSGMVALIFAQVIYRYVLKAPLSWSEELAQYFFSGIIFFGGALLYRGNKHINMSMALDAVKNKFLKQAIICLAHLSSIAFLLVMSWYSLPMAREIIELEVESPSMEWMNLGYIFMIVPVASIISLSMMLEVFLDSARVLKEGK